MPKITPTAEITAAITDAIRRGGYPHVASEAAGVPRAIFADWLKRGKRRGAREPYRGFLAEINKAKAKARLDAEIMAHEADPKYWLRAGPGRETTDSPGWTAAIRPLLKDPTPAALNLFASPDFLQFMHSLRAALQDHPEALEAVSRALTREPRNITQEAIIE